jgi:hypothetical protein
MAGKRRHVESPKSQVEVVDVAATTADEPDLPAATASDAGRPKGQPNAKGESDPKSKGNGKTTASRLRWSGNLPRPGKGDVPWAMKRPELAELSAAHHARIVQGTRAWQELMVPACEALDSERSARGLKWLYSSEELELVLLYGRAAGHVKYEETRAVLAGDDPRPREILGLTKARNAERRPCLASKMRLRDGVPSLTTIWRHKRRFGEEQRELVWLAIERELRLEHLQTEELQEEALVLNLDGSPLLTHYTAPMKSRKHEGALNDPDGPYADRKITAPDAGYVPDSAPRGKSGHGWNLVTISTSTGVPLAWALPPLNESERTTALKIVTGDLARDVAPYLAGKIKVLTADGAFQQPQLRAELRKLGILENIHLVSHAKKKRSDERAAKFNEARFAIKGFPMWQANGHREVVCRCGKGVAKRISLGKDGTARVGIFGQCKNGCGSISIASGQWRFTPDDIFVPCNPDDPADKRDWAFGNPLTFNDLNAAEYGRKRFGRNEGFHGTLSNRFKLIFYKRWFRRAAQARTETAMTFAIMHALSLEQRRRAKAPPGELLAA